MKIAIIGRKNYRNTGIEKFQSKIIPELTKDERFEKVEYKFSSKYPFSITLSRLKFGRKIKSIADDYDKVFIPSQDLVSFNPKSVDAEIIPYIHDILPVTTNFSGWVATPLAKHYAMNIEKLDKVITATETTKNELRFRTRFKGDSKVVHQGIEFSDHSFEKERDIDLLYVGSLIDRKNPEFIKNVFKKAVEKGFTVASVNFEENNLPGKNFVNISDRKLAEIYSRSRFYLHGSKAEGFGRTPVEAQFNGCIPLAFDIPINKEVLGEEGKHWISIDSEKDVFNAINSNISIDRDKVESNAERFNWDQTVENIKKVILND